jgi:uncharacterized damage-inducible protein DinB
MMKTSPGSLLDEALQGWAWARQGVIAELRNLPERTLEFRPNDASRTTRELVQHIVESGLMMSGELTRQNGDFQRQSYAAFMAEYGRGVPRHRTKSALVAALRSTHVEGTKRIREAGEVWMLQVIRQFDGESATRLSWMQHAVAHEEYHRGQLALYARLTGRVPALTKLIQAG